MLNQISSVTHNVNAQGQTEVGVNTLPSCVMLHVVCRFNTLPKGK